MLQYLNMIQLFPFVSEWTALFLFDINKRDYTPREVPKFTPTWNLTRLLGKKNDNYQLVCVTIRINQSVRNLYNGMSTTAWYLVESRGEKFPGFYFMFTN